jgi:hypothetical protein
MTTPQLRECVELVCGFVSRRHVLEPIDKVAQWKYKRRENVISSLFEKDLTEKLETSLARRTYPCRTNVSTESSPLF